MKNKGFTLIEVILGIFLVGLLATVAFPILQFSFRNYSAIKEKEKMYYYCEMAVERLRAKDSDLEDILIQLETDEEIIVEKLGEVDLGEYKCKITKVKEDSYLYNLDVMVYIDKIEGNNSYAKYKVSIQK